MTTATTTIKRRLRFSWPTAVMPGGAGYPQLPEIIELYAQVVDTREDAGMTVEIDARRSVQTSKVSAYGIMPGSEVHLDPGVLKAPPAAISDLMSASRRI